MSSPAEVLLQRRRARKSLIDWSRVCGYEPALHHRYLISRLEAAARGEVKRLAIFLPPGSAKSTYSSVLFPPWYLAQKPQTTILACSHSSHLAESFGRRNRNLISDYKRVLGYDLAADSKAVGEWSTSLGGEFFCAGVGGKIAGRRADLALIDDPIGSKEDAYSDLIRDKIWDWYTYDFRPRLKTNAVVVLIQTRWHEDDLAGRLLDPEKGNPEEWTVISIPLIAGINDPLGRQPGEVLWPEYYNAQMVADAKKSPEVFECLYQQNATPEDGDYFKREWLEANTYGSAELPSNLRIYCASDHAVSLDQEADFTVLLCVGVDPSGVIWVLPDIFWVRYNTEDVVEAMVSMMKRRKPLTWWAESGHISKSIGPFLYKRMRECNAWTYVEERTPARDKPTRAQSIRGRIKMHGIKFPRDAHWWPQARRQMLSFPGGKNDDFVDALAHVGLGLDSIVDGQRPAETPYVVQPPPASRLTLDWIKRSSGRKATLYTNQ